MAYKPVYITDEMQLVVTAVNARFVKLGIALSAYYMFGHKIEVVNRLQQMSNSKGGKEKKFPLIALFTDIPVKMGGSSGFYGSARLNMIVANWTKQNYIASERLEHNFKPILQPIKAQLIESIGLHSQFSYPAEISYTEIERYFFGREGLYGNEGNVLNDFIDCIEIRDLEINLHHKIC